MKHNTREDDLNKLDQSRRNRKQEGSKEHIEALLVSVFEQTKDPILERLRQNLIDVLRQLEEQGENDALWQKYLEAMYRIEVYTSSSTFKKNIAEKIERAVGKEEAERFWKSKGGE